MSGLLGASVGVFLVHPHMTSPDSPMLQCYNSKPPVHLRPSSNDEAWLSSQPGFCLPSHMTWSTQPMMHEDNWIGNGSWNHPFLGSMFYGRYWVFIFGPHHICRLVDFFWVYFSRWCQFNLNHHCRPGLFQLQEKAASVQSTDVPVKGIRWRSRSWAQRLGSVKRGGIRSRETREAACNFFESSNGGYWRITTWLAGKIMFDYYINFLNESFSSHVTDYSKWDNHWSTRIF